MNLNYIFQKIIQLLLKFASNEQKIKYLRRQGMQIGKNCIIYPRIFSTEPYLIEIGNHVAIAQGTMFITHDGGIWNFRDEFADADVFGAIAIGNNVSIGSNCTILPNTTIGNNCIVAAGSVVRGRFPDNSVIVGNPAKVVYNINYQRFFYLQNPGLLQTKNMSHREKTQTIKEHFGIKR
jgi:acetyltransferase-like isoleucine patch superfamily enzyme